MLQIVFEGNKETTFIRFKVLNNIKMSSIKYNRQKGGNLEEVQKVGCSKGSLEQTHKSMSTPRTCKNRCDMNISYAYNDFDFGSINH